MPLSQAVNRQHYHTRRVECFGYLRDDGLWDIEGHMVDVKTYNFINRARGEVKAGEPVHDMWIRLTLDDKMKIIAAEAVTDASPFPICSQVNQAFKSLKGLSIKKGWTKQVKKYVGGIKGCTHLFELLGPMATTAIQTIYGTKMKIAREQGTPELNIKESIVMLNTCYAYAEDGVVVKEYFPDYYRSRDVDSSS